MNKSEANILVRSRGTRYCFK